jgi:probable F420-dependent oxidoreductase
MIVRGRRFRFGVQLRPQRTSWTTYSNAVRLVEELGFDTVWNSDHLLPASGPAQDPRFETLTTLAAMAALTDRIRVGTLVFGALYRDPATLAKSAATVDHISNGRLEFAIGAAWSKREFKAYGLHYPSLSERYARLDETLEVVKSLWTHAKTSYSGHYYRLADAPFAPKPVQQPFPPITVGGVGPEALRLAAKHATAANVFGSPDQITELARALEGFCAEVDRDFDEIELSLHADLAIGWHHEDAEAVARRAAAAHGLSLDSSDNWIIGDPDEVIAQVKRYAEVGISHVIVHLDDPFDTGLMHLLSGSVIPALA